MSPLETSLLGEFKARRAVAPRTGSAFQVSGWAGGTAHSHRLQLPAEQAEDKQRDSSPSSPAMLRDPAQAPP